MKEKNVYMGCGPDIREGFIHADIRKMPHVDIVCVAWELSNHVKDLNHIYSRHMLEHLTNFEADRTLRDWLKSLKNRWNYQNHCTRHGFSCTTMARSGVE